MAYFFIKYLLDFYSHKGYIVTMDSNKFNPYKTSFRRYIRFITNLGIIQFILIIGFVFLVVIYPLVIATELGFTARQAFIATIISFAYSVSRSLELSLNIFSFTEMEYKNKENNELKKEIEVDVSKELTILKDILIKFGRDELTTRKQFGDLGEIEVHLSEKKEEAFFVITLYLHSSNINEIVESIETYAFGFFNDLRNTTVDINNFVLSYFVKIDGVFAIKNLFHQIKTG